MGRIGPFLGSCFSKNWNVTQNPTITEGKLFMNIRLLQAFVGLLFLTAILANGSKSYPASPENSPVIHVRQTSHAFSPVFEGEKLSHTFTVVNRGMTDLHIKRITSS